MRRAACLLCLLAGCGAKSELSLAESGGVPSQGVADSGVQPVGSGTDGGTSAGTDAETPSGGIEYATCGPADGPAFLLDIGPGWGCAEMHKPPNTYDQIEVWNALPPGFATILISPANGSAQSCVSGACTPATDAVLGIGPSDGGTVSGFYEMHFADGSSRGGRFVVPICPVQPTCG